MYRVQKKELKEERDKYREIEHDAKKEALDHFKALSKEKKENSGKSISNYIMLIMKQDIPHTQEK